MDQFKIESVPGIHEGIRILRLSGPFTLRTLFDFQAVVRSNEAPVTLIDVTDVPYMDSASLGAIMTVHTSSQRHKRQYALVGVSERLLTLFQVAGVDGILVTVPTLEEAQRKFANAAVSN
ncbi:MAG TPA: STAS domain-containing protein [Bryobacteraceae bacterium]|nr:STAS domain-containing protein [Bryobacteraceae bacterium]